MPTKLSLARIRLIHGGGQMAKRIAKQVCRQRAYDAVVVGGGPNGLACAIAIQQAGHAVLLVEANDTLGGACRTQELTVPGFMHDVGSAVHPLGIGSPFFRTLPLERFGLRWINPPNAYVHAFAPEKAIIVSRDIAQTTERLGSSYGKLMTHLSPDWDELSDMLLHPLKLLRAPWAMAYFGYHALQSINSLAHKHFGTPEAKAAFAGVAAHSALRFDAPGAASIGLTLAIAAHAVGWPIPEGGAQSITNSLVKYFESIGGEVVADCPVRACNELPECRYLFFDVTPRQLLRIAGNRLPPAYKRKLMNYHYGPASFKVDWALSKPIPWNDREFGAAPTVHLGGTIEELAIAEGDVWKGEYPPNPFVLLAQPTLFDPSRAPDGNHIAWAYCHVPAGSQVDRVDAMESQIERFAEGFKETIIARSVLNPQRLEQINENLVEGDINGGSLVLGQLLARPTLSMIPYATPLPNTFLCSSSTPPGSGVHGMCGYYAAIAAMKFGDPREKAIPVDFTADVRATDRIRPNR